MKKYYFFKEFAEVIGVNRHTLNRWKKSGKLCPYIDENGKEYYSEKQAEMFIAPLYGEIIQSGDNWIDLRSIERELVRGRYKWKEACDRNQEIPYYFNGKSGSFYLLSCKNNKLTISIDGKEATISTSMILSVKLGRITGAISFDYKYAIGEHIEMGKTDITIIEQTKTGANKVRAYLYRCNKCNQTNLVNEYNISDLGCCPVCAGTKVVKGVNDIATTDIWMVPFFDDPTLTTQYSHGSKMTPAFHCPDCGRKRKKPLQIRILYRTRSIGCVCGDGYSYPNKFMFSLLEQLLKQKKITEFDNEYSDDWTDRRKFDFLVLLAPEDKRIIIEMDGGLGHGNKCIDDNISPEESKTIDAWKDLKAKEQGIPVYRIDARQSEMEYLKDSISRVISSLIDLNDISWEEADKFAISNLAKQVCQYYEKNKPLTTEQLGKIFHIAQSTALSYIQRGEQYGWCSYDWDLYYDRKYAFARKEHKNRKQRVVEVCEYYKAHKPILAVEMARYFGVYPSTIINYLQDGVELGYEPYDKKYAYSKSVEGLQKASRNHLKRAVLCFTKEEIFFKRYDSLKEAAENHGVSISSIHRCCKKRGSSAGLLFRYEDDCELSVE